MATPEKNYVKFQLKRDENTMQREFDEYLKTFDPPLVRTYVENGITVKVYGDGKCL